MTLSSIEGGPGDLGRLGEIIASDGEAEILALGDDRVVRLLRNSRGLAQIEREAATIEAVDLAGVPVAKVYGVVDFKGRPGLVLERLMGPDMLTALRRGPWRAWSLGSALGATHARLNAVRAPARLRSAAEMLERMVVRAEALPPDLREIILSVLVSLPAGEMVCHGDFKPGNVILDRRRGPVVIDWPNACRGAPECDVARTLQILRLRAPRLRPPAARAATIAYWALVTRAYLRSYKERRPLDTALLSRWGVVWAARRYVMGVPPEHEALERIIRSYAPAAPRPR